MPLSDDHFLVRWAVKQGFQPPPGRENPGQGFPAMDPQLAVASGDDPDVQSWVARMLRESCDEMASTAKGRRNHILFKKAFRVGTFVAGGYLGESDAEQALATAAHASGLADDEITRTVRSGLEYSRGQPAVLQLKPRGTGIMEIPETTFDVDTEMDADADSDKVRLVLPLLPQEFWDARQTLSHIRQAAHSRVVGADALLGCVLARVAAMMPHYITLDTGVGGGNAGLNLLVALIGASGTTKTSSDSVAELYLDTPSALDAIPIGSGEGIAEKYMGMAADPTDFDTKGNPKKKRQQVKHNNFFVCDEGRYLVEQSGRSGATAVSTLRRAATGANLGHANASEDRYRDVRDYRLGLVAGFQPTSIKSLFSREEIEGGTPQRLLCLAASDRHNNDPDNVPEWPGYLAWAPPEGRNYFALPESVKSEIRQLRVKTQSEQIVVEELDAHKPLMWVKLAALLAALEMRLDVNEEDWRLAKLLYRSSRKTQDELLRFFGRQAIADSEQASQAKITHKVAEANAVDEANRAVQRVARQLASRVYEECEQGAAMTRGAVYRKVAYRDRHLFGRAVEHALAMGFLHDDGGSGLRPGSQDPLKGGVTFDER